MNYAETCQTILRLKNPRYPANKYFKTYHNLCKCKQKWLPESTHVTIDIGKNYVTSKEHTYQRGEAPPTCGANLRIGWNSSHLAASGVESAVN